MYHYDVASFPGSPSFRAILLRITFDPPEKSAGSKVIRGIIAQQEGESGNEATVIAHVHVVYILVGWLVMWWGMIVQERRNRAGSGLSLSLYMYTTST